MTAEQRIDAILEALLAYARHDFRPKAPVSDALDGIDAIAAGLNMLAEELDGEVASRRELDAACHSLKQTQERLVRTEKLAAIGQLASGVAHDINSPAAWVVLSLDMLGRGLAELDTLLRAPPEQLPAVQQELRRRLGTVTGHLREALDGMDRIRDVAGQLRSYSRPEWEERVPVQLNALVQSACRLAQPLFVNGTRLTCELGSLPLVVGDRRRLSQVLTNLLVNAVQAVELNGEGAAVREVRVATSFDGSNVVLRVEDSGPGIPAEHQDRIFEPFFTTKPAAAGTGLGLALVADMVEWHRGSIQAKRSELGGACFEIRLPSRSAVPAGGRFDGGEPGGQVTPPRVLFVDDHKSLLRSYALALGETYVVCLAESAEEALRRLEENPAFDAIICDVQMPGVSGIELYQVLARRWPELAARVIFLSGGTAESGQQAFLDDCARPVLIKPVRLETLRARVQEVARAAAKTSGVPKLNASEVGAQ